MNSEAISPGTVFISYAGEDRNRVELLVKYLADIGLDVWWDRDIEVGTSFRSAIQNSLDEAACVLVIWTKASVEKDFVRSEASTGQKKGILLPWY
jgi:TIR domain